MLTAQILTKIAPSITGSRAVAIANHLNTICPMYGINTPDIMHEFLARLLVECGEFKTFVENLNYSTDALISKFGRHRISKEDAEKFGRNILHKANQLAIANIIYGGMFGKTNLGNTEPTDGWALRGSGPMQLTGRKMITLFTIFHNKQFATSFSIFQMAELLRTDIAIGIHSACWLFAIAKDLIQLAKDDYLKQICKKINGGLNGYEDTKEYYDLCVKYIV